MIRTIKALRLPRFRSLYIIWLPLDAPGVAKIGISDAAHLRKEQIRSELSYFIRGRIDTVVCIAFPVLSAHRLEKVLHRVFSRWSYPGFRGTNGGTEWFYCSINAGSAVLWVCLKAYFGWQASTAWALAIFFCPILDMVLFASLLFLAQFAALIFAFWAALMLIDLAI